jgi:elongation factor P
MYSTSEFKKGLKVEYEGKPWMIVDFQHVNPGKGASFTRTKLKNLQTKQVLEISVRSGDMLGVPDLEIRDMQYLFREGDNYVFMDNKTYEQFSLSAEDLGDNRFYVVENGVVRCTFFQNKPVDIDVENFVNMKVVETAPNFKGDTSGGGGKPATLETGLVVQVPFHIVEGDVIRIDTRVPKYMEKVKQ